MQYRCSPIAWKWVHVHVHCVEMCLHIGLLRKNCITAPLPQANKMCGEKSSKGGKECILLHLRWVSRSKNLNITGNDTPKNKKTAATTVPPSSTISITIYLHDVCDCTMPSPLNTSGLIPTISTTKSSRKNVLLFFYGLLNVCTC